MNQLRSKYSFLLSYLTSGNIAQAFAILIVGLILTVTAAFFANREDASKENEEYKNVCNDIKTKVLIRLHAHAQLLRSAAALFGASDTVSRSEWQKFVSQVKIDTDLPGVQGIGFSMIIPGNQLQNHIKQIRSEGFSNYTIRPASDRPVYTSIIYLEPFEGRNLRAFGYDMFTEPVRRKAMELSRDSDDAVLSGKVILVQETDEDVQPGTLMYVPVYRHSMPANTPEQRQAAIWGWVYSPYRMNNLMQGILGRWDLNRKSRIHLQIYEDSLSDKTLLYSSQPNDSLKHDDLPSRTVSLPIDFKGKIWILEFTQSHDQSKVNAKTIIIITGGIAISFLLLALTLSIFFNLRQSKQIAGQLTSDLKESEERFKILLNSTAEAIYGIDLNGNCTFTNTAFYRILGYPRTEQFEGKNIHALIHYAHADGSRFDVNDCHIHRSFVEGEGMHVDNEVFWKADGTCFPVEYWSYPFLFNGKIEGSVVTFFDITLRKQAEQKVTEAIIDARKANQAKSEFLSRMSHELRTPMNSILGFGQLLQMGELNPAQLKGVNHILTSGKHLLTLINEVLDIVQIDSGRISFSLEPVQVKSVVSEAVDMFHPTALKKRVTIELTNTPEDNLFVMADHHRLKQVLLNLINNAIKYNKAGGSVSLKTEWHPAETIGTSSVRISVSDTGQGISAPNIPKLFKPFERIGAEKTETEGTGLGLAVAKKIMEAMGGNIGLESVPGSGSTFWIELPHCKSRLETFETADSQTIIRSESDKYTGTILYIEDNSSNIELVEQILVTRRSGIRLISSKNGGSAVELATKYKPGLILLDLDLPDIHGTKVIGRLKVNENTREIPVVIISADAMPEHIEKLMKAGAINYLTKPLDINGFLTLVDEWIC